MKKTILITGSTDGIGLETAKKFLFEGHIVLIHGRNEKKLAHVKEQLLKSSNGTIESYLADLSNLQDVQNLANQIKQNHTKLDILINNAGVYKTPHPITKDNLDIRFVVNTIAPYLLTKELLPIFNSSSRIINLSSAAQAPVSLQALLGKEFLNDAQAYAQSKLALTMLTYYFSQRENTPMIVSINPASFLGSKMVKEAYGMSGKDINIGVDILYRASLSREFNEANGKYFDNDIGKFTPPHPDGENLSKCEKIIKTIEAILNTLNIS